MTTIIVTHENNQIDEHDFEPEIKSITIGRRSTNDVCIANLSVSGSHAKIVITDEGAMVEDLNSTNGTYINGRLISRQKLNDGDDIVLGRIRVTFLMPALQNMGQEVNASASHDATDAGHDGDDEPPLTLAEKARLHRTQIAHNRVDNPADQSGAQADTPVNTKNSSPARHGGTAPTITPTSALASGHVSADSVPAEAPADTATQVTGQQMADHHASPADNSGAAADSITPDSAIAGKETSAETPVAVATRAQTAHEPVMHELDSPVLTQTGAVIEIKNGAKSGQVLPIDKPVTTLGRPGIQIAAIMKKPEGYFLMHIESDGKVDPPRLNSNSIGDEPVLLRSGDALNVAGIDVQFMLS